jgi:excisionase family DNA binding protein
VFSAVWVLAGLPRNLSADRHRVIGASQDSPWTGPIIYLPKQKSHAKHSTTASAKRGALDAFEAALSSFEILQRTTDISRATADKRTQTPVWYGKAAYSVSAIAKLLSLGRVSIFLVIREKRLRAVKCGSRTLILAEDLRSWINSWPANIQS